MAGNNNSSSGTNRMAVPEAKDAMKRFKEEVASELGVPLKDGYNGDLTSKQAGSIGGEMVKKMIMKQEETDEIRTFCRKNKQRMAFDIVHTLFLL